MKVGQRISEIHSDSGELITGKIVSRAGKAISKYKICFNLQKDSDGSVAWFDLEKRL